MNKIKRMVSVAILTAVMVFGATMSVFAAYADEAEGTANEYYVAFSNQNYAIRNSNKMTLSEDGDYYLEKVSLSSTIKFYVTDGNGVRYYSSRGEEMSVDDATSYRYDIRFSPDKIYDAEEDGYKATACHVTYAFYIPETYSVKLGETETELTYNPYFTSYDLYYLSSVKLTAGTVVSYGDEEPETHAISSDGAYRILFTPSVVRDGNEYAFDVDGNYGSGDDYVYNLYIEDAAEYFAVFDEGASGFTCAPTATIGGADAYPLLRYEKNTAAEEYRVSDLFVNERDASLKYRIYEAELTGNYRLIDDDNDEDTNVSKIDVADVGWYELSFLVGSENYVTSTVWSDRELDGYYIVGDFNGYGFNEQGGVDIDKKFAFEKVEEGDDDYNDDYEQYILYLTITRKDLAEDDVEFYITDGKDKYKNGTKYISLNTAGKYKILFSDEHIYSQGRRYRYTLLDEKDTEREIEISTTEEFVAFARSCSDSADYSVSLSVYLTCDLDFTGKEFVPVVWFSGKFYGGYHTISGIALEGDGDCLAAFETVTRTGRIERLNVENLSLNGKDADYVGFVGKNYGTLQKISVSGGVTGDNYVGGIAAFNGVSRVDDDSATLDSNNIVQTGVSDGCVNRAAIVGRANVGGVVGFNSGDILSCVNEGDVTPYTDTKSNLTNVGGIAGFSAGKLSDCENDGKVGLKSYAVYVGGAVGFCTGENYFLVNRGAVAGRKYVGGIAGGYGNVTQSENDRNDYFGGMTVEEIVNKYFNTDEADEVLVGARHDMLYLQNYSSVEAGSYAAGVLATSAYDGLSVQNSFSLGDVTASSGGYVGGIVGNGNVSVVGCFSSGVLKASGTNANYVGGIAGNGGTVQYSASVADLFGSDYVGGIAGNIVNYIASSYTNVNIVSGDGKKNIGGIAGFAEGFNPSLNTFPDNFKYNYYIGATGGVAGTEYGKSFDYAAASMSEEKLISEGSLSIYLNEYFNHEYWQGGKENSYPVLSYMYNCYDIEDIDDETELFKKHAENLQSAMESCAKVHYSVIFMEWNKDNGDLYDDDGKIVYDNFEKIASFRAEKGESIDAVALKYAELRDGKYVYEGDDEIYFVTLRDVTDVKGNLVVYAEYTPAIGTISTDDGSVLVEGLFDKKTRISLEKTGDYYRVKFTLNGEEIAVLEYTVKFRKPDAGKEYTVYKIAEEKTNANAVVSGDYLSFVSDGGYFEISENGIFSLTKTEIGLTIALGSVCLTGIVLLIVFLVRKHKKSKCGKNSGEAR